MTGKRRGAVAVETAVVFIPVLFIGLVGILEFGRVFMVRQVVVNAAREGARSAILPGATHAQVISRMSTYLQSTSVNAPGKTLEVRNQSGAVVTDLSTIPAHDPISVTVRVPWSQTNWGVNFFMGNRNLEATVTMRKE